MKLTRNSELMTKLKELLIGKYFLRENYTYEINALVRNLGVQVNTSSFDFTMQGMEIRKIGMKIILLV